MKQYSLRTKLSLAISIIILISITFISVFANIIIRKQFETYIKKQQLSQTKELVSNVSKQYDPKSGEWNMDYIDIAGMNSIHNGYMITILDSKSNVVWNAQATDMRACSMSMMNISNHMDTRYPQLNGDFTTDVFSLSQGNSQIGTMEISYYGPFFFSENDTSFLDTLNYALIWIGSISLLGAFLISAFMAKKFSNPVLKTATVAKKMADGDYGARIMEKSTTKELTLLTSSINHLAETLENQTALRKQLTSDVAHELRTPLTNISTHTEAMISGLWEPTPERLNSFHEEISRITNIVRDLENLARIDDGSLFLTKVNLDLLELINQCLAVFEVEIKTKNIKTTIFGNPSFILADENRIAQVIHNLLSNAIKYTKRNGFLEISLNEKPGFVSIEIKDNGSGIASEELPYIFERFYRADKSRNRSTGGSGIGLAIVKAIIDAHKGEIIVKSALNVGSSFILKLPKE